MCPRTRGQRLAPARDGAHPRGAATDRAPLCGDGRLGLGNNRRRVLVALAGGGPRELAELSGVWAGTERPPQYSDCVDVDLSFTPATNTLPIRRLGLDIGEVAEIHVAWLVWPKLSVRRVLQRYARLAEDRYRYTQDEFEAELTVDRQGLVLEYQGLWRAIAST